MWSPNSIKGVSGQSPQNSDTGLADIAVGKRLYDGPEKRAKTRYPSKLQARFFYGKMVFKGVLRDVSETGMFISTDMRLQPRRVLNLMILINKKVLQIPVTIRRTVRPDTNEGSGIGVELLSTPQAYLDYIIDISIHNNTPAGR